MRIKLTYTDIATQKPQEIVVNTPVAIGWDIGELPTKIQGRDVAHVLIFDDSIAAYHALVEERKGQIIVKDMESDRPIGVSKNRFTVGEIKFTFEVLSEVLEPASVVGGGSFDRVDGLSNDSNKCQKMVGFLVKRPCDRTSPIGCPHCNDGEDDLNDYDSDYVYYENYGSYNDWGHTYYRDRHYYHYDYDNRRVEFTEADNVAFETEGDRDFEQDYSAS